MTSIVDRNSRLTMEFTLDWQGATARHRERLFAEKVSVWRDLFPGTMAEQLLGRQVGDTVSVVVTREMFYAPSSPRLLRRIRPAQFAPPPSHRRQVDSPLYGRFYPQYYLQGVPGVFQVSTAPCRFLGEEGDELLFSLEHPLAGRDLTLSATIVDIDAIRVERGGRCEAWLETICDNGPGMQERLPARATDFFHGRPFMRRDEGDDRRFYHMPRMVQHLDRCALTLITAEYGRLLPRGGDILDLMGSWDSHLPDDLEVGSLTVLGMNEKELAKNRRATRTVVHDLNEQPTLPFADASCDAVINTAAIEYATDPQHLCREMARVLRPDGVAAIAFSNRCFESKAIALWAQLHEFERLGLVVELLNGSGPFRDIATLSVRGYPRPEEDPHPLPQADPVFLVTARKA